MYVAFIRALVFALSLFPALAGAQLSGGLIFPGPGTPASSGASPTWGNTAAAVNGTCSFVTTCTVSSTMTVASGFVVAVAGINHGAAGTATITGIHVCGTALNVDSTTSAAVSNYVVAIGSGTVTGGTCTVTVTSSVTSDIQNAGIALGTLANLSSTTPGTACSASFTGAGSTPFVCGSGLTVSAGGFGISGIFQNNAANLPASSGNVTIDVTATNSGGTNSSIGIGHQTVSGSTQIAAHSFCNCAIVGEPFR